MESILSQAKISLLKKPFWIFSTAELLKKQSSDVLVVSVGVTVAVEKYKTESDGVAAALKKNSQTF